MNEVKKNTLVRISETEFETLKNIMEKDDRSFFYLVSAAVSEYAAKKKKELSKKSE